jgi:hypothetical protein
VRVRPIAKQSRFAALAGAENLFGSAAGAQSVYCAGADSKYEQPARPITITPLTIGESMKTMLSGILTGLCVAGVLSLAGSSALAQTPEVKEKPRMYTYVSNWAIPRAKWADMDKDNVGTNKALDGEFRKGAIVGYGDDTNLVHTADGATHDNWWSAMSLAALLNVLEGFYKSGSVTSPALASATKHWDGVYVSRFYSWKPGTYKDAFTRTSTYKLKADAPNNAVETVAKSLMVPVMEKLLAEGAIVEYEIDQESVHTASPGMFFLVYIAPNSAGLEKAVDAVREAARSSPLFGPAFGSMVDFELHRDYLSHSNATYK